MPRPKKHTPPKFAEPYTVDVADLESYNDMVSKPPYTYLPRSLPQNVLALMLTELWNKGKRYVRIYLPSDVFADSYKNNPAMFAQVVRNTKRVPFEYITMRNEPELGRYRVTASETVEQKRGSYLGTAVATLLGEMSKVGDDGFSVHFPYEGMSQAYANDQFVFRHRLEKLFRAKTENSSEKLRIALVEGGYRITRLPKDFQQF